MQRLKRTPFLYLNAHLAPIFTIRFQCSKSSLLAMDGPSDSYPVYIGVWTNWSYGQVFGSTLTLTRENGVLLIAFVSFFVTIIGTHIWRIASFFIHWAYSTQYPTDALHRQRQVILRGSASPISSLLAISQLAWASRQAARRPYLRLLPIGLTAVLVGCALALTSVF